MESSKPTSTKIYFLAMAAFWFIFGLITTFYPALMNLFQTEAGISSITEYSDHVWFHDGLDILSISVLLFALSREMVSRFTIRAAAIVALLVAFGIGKSLLTTPYWNMMFVVPGISCFAFSIWGFVLASKGK